MGSTICVEKLDFISSYEAVGIKECEGVIPPEVDVTTYWMGCDY